MYWDFRKFILSGVLLPSLLVLVDISKVLGVSLDYLLNDNLQNFYTLENVSDEINENINSTIFSLSVSVRKLYRPKKIPKTNEERQEEKEKIRESITCNLKKILPEIRKERKLTQASIAYSCDIDPKNYQKYEAGKTLPQVHILYALSKVLNVSIDYLIFGEGADSLPFFEGLPEYITKKFNVITKNIIQDMESLVKEFK